MFIDTSVDSKYIVSENCCVYEICNMSICVCLCMCVHTLAFLHICEFCHCIWFKIRVFCFVFLHFDLFVAGNSSFVDKITGFCISKACILSYPYTVTVSMFKCLFCTSFCNELKQYLLLTQSLSMCGVEIKVSGSKRLWY